MTEKITQPIAPDVLAPGALGPLHGNTHDDDAIAYAENFEAADHTPVKITGVHHEIEKVSPGTRLLSRTVVVGNSADPVMLLPLDRNRKSLVLQASSVAAQLFRIGSSKSDVFNGDTLFSAPGVVVTNLIEHTGAIWAYSTDAANITLTVIAVTE